MTSDAPMPNPFDLLPDDGWVEPTRRELVVFGATAELYFVPQRKNRAGAPSEQRPAFRPSVADRIIANESLWESGDAVLTPNKFPFGRRHTILWTRQRVRESTVELLRVGFELVGQHGGTLLGNSIGAAASIQRAHVHLVDETRPFLGELQHEPHDLGDVLPADIGVDIVRLANVPFVAIGVRGDSPSRARATATLIELRMTATFNFIDDGAMTWVFPRRIETPAPDFPYALGAAELWGRWCYGDREPFDAATSEALETALERALAPWPARS